jgi:2-methylcitrate dehydratase PrpD
VRELGVRFDVMRTSIKKWSVGNPAQAPLDSLYDLIKANRVSAADVDKVVVRLDRVGSKTVNNRSMPDINLQYLASVMLLDGTLTLVAAHDVARMRDPQVVALMQRVELIDDEEMTRAAGAPRRRGNKAARRPRTAPADDTGARTPGIR